jgi:thioesterase domain-containing protein
LDVVPIIGNHIDLVVEPNLATNRPLIETAVVQTYSPAESRKREDLSST